MQVTEFALDSATSAVTIEVNKGFYNQATREVTIIFGVSGSRPADYPICIVPAAYRPSASTKGICSVAITAGGMTIGACEIISSTGHIKHYLTSQATSFVSGIIKYKL